MGEISTAVFDWIGQNENILSGMVAIAVLSGLLITVVRRLVNRPRPATTSVEPNSVEPNSVEPNKEAEPDATIIEQDIRYCQTADGIRIAYATTGRGSPIVRCLGWFTHLEAEWRSSLGRGFWARLSRNHRLIRYDGRGIGLSGPSTKFSAETRLSDFEAVLDAAGVEKFALVATSEGTRTALRYAAKNPDRVTHLILVGTAAYNKLTREDSISMQSSAYLSMIESGWGKATHQKLFADLFLGMNASPEEAEFFMEMQRCSASQEVATAYYHSLFETETGFEVASDIRVPTLIIHAKDDQITPFQAGVELAAEIPGARFKPLEGDCHWLLLENSNSEDHINSIEAFIRDE